MNWEGAFYATILTVCVAGIALRLYSIWRMKRLYEQRLALTNEVFNSEDWMAKSGRLLETLDDCYSRSWKFWLSDEDLVQREYVMKGK